MFRAIFVGSAALVLALAPAHAAKIETAPADAPVNPNAAKKLPSTLPTPTPEPVAVPAATPPAKDAPIRTPDEIITKFFESLKADRVDAAYDTLNAEFAMADRAEESKSMRAQTQKALDAYGPVLGWEMVREERVGTHLMRRTYVLTGEQLPLRWKLYFYKPADRWKLIDLRIDDALVEWFDDAPPKKPAARER